MKKLLTWALLLALATAMPAQKQKRHRRAAGTADRLSAYLMVYHKDQDHGLHAALSRDGYTWTALNGDKPIVGG